MADNWSSSVRMESSCDLNDVENTRFGKRSGFLTTSADTLCLPCNFKWIEAGWSVWLSGDLALGIRLDIKGYTRNGALPDFVLILIDSINEIRTAHFRRGKSGC